MRKVLKHRKINWVNYYGQFMDISEKAVNDLLRKCDSLANVELASKF